MIPEQNWVYRAKVTRVIDGDTIDVIVDNGFYNQRLERFRLLNVDTPEMRGATIEAGKTARQFVVDWMAMAAYLRRVGSVESNEWPLIVQSTKADSFGRFLATVWRVCDGACLNEDLISNGFAEPYK